MHRSLPATYNKPGDGKASTIFVNAFLYNVLVVKKNSQINILYLILFHFHLTINLIKSHFLGSEWDYVIISLVRSMKKEDIEREPSLSWLREHLGFVTDDHQMNVGITRARRGLCIIGRSRTLKALNTLN